MHLTRYAEIRCVWFERLVCNQALSSSANHDPWCQSYSKSSRFWCGDTAAKNHGPGEGPPPSRPREVPVVITATL